MSQQGNKPPVRNYCICEEHVVGLCSRVYKNADYNCTISEEQWNIAPTYREGYCKQANKFRWDGLRMDIAMAILACPDGCMLVSQQDLTVLMSKNET
jgi:hypothetical protein